MKKYNYYKEVKEDVDICLSNMVYYDAENVYKDTFVDLHNYLLDELLEDVTLLTRDGYETDEQKRVNVLENLDLLDIAVRELGFDDKVKYECFKEGNYFMLDMLIRKFMVIRIIDLTISGCEKSTIEVFWDNIRFEEDIRWF